MTLKGGNSLHRLYGTRFNRGTNLPTGAAFQPLNNQVGKCAIPMFPMVAVAQGQQERSMLQDIADNEVMDLTSPLAGLISDAHRNADRSFGPGAHFRCLNCSLVDVLRGPNR